MKWCFELQMEAKYLSVAFPSVLLVVELIIMCRYNLDNMYVDVTF